VVEVKIKYNIDMKIDFVYDIEKDILNYIAGSKSINHKGEQSAATSAYLEKYGEFEEGNLRTFINDRILERSLDFPSLIQIMQSDWDNIESIAIERIEGIFRTKIPHELITAYLTTNGRCSYNIEKGYFFVSPAIENVRKTVIHELFHFYTWYGYHDELMKNGMNNSDYNDIKESFTELLNIEFVDILGENSDAGYEIQMKMRESVRELWLEYRDIEKIIRGLAKQ
jgi:hypothetical protein